MEILTTALPYVLEVLVYLVVTAIGIGGTWLTIKISQSKHLTNIGEAVSQVQVAAQQTVRELQQVYVATWKEEAKNGKLTDEQKERLKQLLYERTKAQLSGPAVGLLEAAQVDLTALIQSAGEAAINRMRDGNPLLADFV